MVAWIATPGEGELTVGTKGPARRIDDTTEVWRQIGDLLIKGRRKQPPRFDRLEGDVATLKTDVAVLKTGVSELKTDVSELKTDVTSLREQVNRLELAFDRQTNRVDAQFDSLRALIMRPETKRS